jgi:hypothetical protein
LDLIRCAFEATERGDHAAAVKIWALLAAVWEGPDGGEEDESPLPQACVMDSVVRMGERAVSSALARAAPRSQLRATALQFANLVAATPSLRAPWGARLMPIFLNAVAQPEADTPQLAPQERRQMLVATAQFLNSCPANKLLTDGAPFAFALTDSCDITLQVTALENLFRLVRHRRAEMLAPLTQPRGVLPAPTSASIEALDEQAPDLYARFVDIIESYNETRPHGEVLPFLVRSMGMGATCEMEVETKLYCGPRVMALLVEDERGATRSYAIEYRAVRSVWLRREGTVTLRLFEAPEGMQDYLEFDTGVDGADVVHFHFASGELVRFKESPFRQWILAAKQRRMAEEQEAETAEQPSLVERWSLPVAATAAHGDRRRGRELEAPERHQLAAAGTSPAPVPTQRPLFAATMSAEGLSPLTPSVAPQRQLPGRVAAAAAIDPPAILAHRKSAADQEAKGGEAVPRVQQPPRAQARRAVIDIGDVHAPPSEPPVAPLVAPPVAAHEMNRAAVQLVLALTDDAATPEPPRPPRPAPVPRPAPAAVLQPAVTIDEPFVAPTAAIAAAAPLVAEVDEVDAADEAALEAAMVVLQRALEERMASTRRQGTDKLHRTLERVQTTIMDGRQAIAEDLASFRTSYEDEIARLETTEASISSTIAKTAEATNTSLASLRAGWGALRAVLGQIESESSATLASLQTDSAARFTALRRGAELELRDINAQAEKRVASLDPMQALTDYLTRRIGASAQPETSH